MNFILSPEIIKDIIFAMENQEYMSVFDSERSMCVPVPEDFDALSDFSAANRFYPLPEWKPAQGFRLMEVFTAKIRNPLVREALQEAFRERKGVFRRFKEILKTKPELETQWFPFKEAAMQRIVYDWYNELRLCWGLERVASEEEELSPLIRQDFSFEVITGEEHISRLLKQFDAWNSQNSSCKSSVCFSSGGTSTESIEQTLSSCVETIAAQLRKDFFLSGFCSEAAVCITASAGIMPTAADTISTDACGYDSICGFCVLIPAHGSEAAVVSALYVLPEYRGMGIGKELLNQAVHYARKAADMPIIFAELSVPGYFHAFLERSGFTRTGLLYSLC